MGSDFRKLVDKALKVQMRTFGEDMTFYPKSGGVLKIRAIFDNAYQAVDPDTQEIISANQSMIHVNLNDIQGCLLYTSPSPRDQRGSRMPSSA